MEKQHSLKEYIEALKEAGLLVSCTVGDCLQEKKIDCLSYDTRTLSGTSLFLCKGAHFKPEYLAEALKKGAAAYVSEREFPVEAPHILVRDIRYAMVVLGQLFYNHVTEKLVSVGITGTKGKSTTAYYLRAVLNEWLRAEGKPECAILSSINNYDGVVREESHLTTPEVLDLYQHFENAVESGISYLVMEVSSQALKYGRVRGMHFSVGAWLNIGNDHISAIEHPTFEDYFSSKLKLFDLCSCGCVNTDAEHAEEALARARKAGCRVLTFGSHPTDDICCEKIEKREDGTYFTVRSEQYNGEFSLTMPGIFNVSNALAAMAMSAALGVPEKYVRAGLRTARAGGRMQVYRSRDKEVTVIVDYAHNAMSFEALYRSTEVEYPDAKKISVFGCPGKKALQRRKDLGELSGKHCSYVYITEEDSGEEPFEKIAADIEKYVACPHTVLEDRAECIRRAILEQEGKRVILLTGKGEETRMKRGNEYVETPSDVDYTLRWLREYDEKRN